MLNDTDWTVTVYKVPGCKPVNNAEVWSMFSTVLVTTDTLPPSPRALMIKESNTPCIGGLQDTIIDEMFEMFAEAETLVTCKGAKTIYKH